MIIVNFQIFAANNGRAPLLNPTSAPDKLTGNGLFTFIRDTARKKNVFAAPEAFLKLDGNFGVHEWAVASSPSSTSQR